MKQIALMRHGDWDYRTDSLLPEGEERAKVKAVELSKILKSPSLIYSSPACRTIQTARILADELGTGSVEVRDELKGLGTDIMRKIVKLSREQKISILNSWRNMNGIETLGEVVSRMNTLLAEVWDTEFNSAVCVTHGENMGAYLEEHNWIDFAEYRLLK